MSTKVLPAGEVAEVLIPAWVQAEKPEEPPPEAEQHNPELDALRARVVELEGAIPRMVEQARTEARRAAEAEATTKAGQASQEVSRRVAATATEFASLRVQMRRQMEEDLVRLAVAVARRIVRRELAVDPGALTGIARAAIDQLEVREIHRIRVSARDAELVRKFLVDSGLPAQIVVLPDAALETGSLVFETAQGTVDASAGVQLDEIDRGLADLVRRMP